jgi:hypothetical protein
VNTAGCDSRLKVGSGGGGGGGKQLLSSNDAVSIVYYYISIQTQAFFDR